jgi:threonine synthase
MTTVKSDNIFNIAIKGSFDDCQNIIKEIFSDEDFKKSKNLTAINSINWARIMCQMVYYFYTFSRIDTVDKKVLFSVPTGNFGDILAGYIAKKMGLKIDMLNIATNDNDILTRTLNSGKHELRKVKETSSPSIDIQISSNFERLLFDVIGNPAIVSDLMIELKTTGTYELDDMVLAKIREHFCSFSVNQDEVDSTIINAYENLNIIIDPHTSVALASSEKCIDEYDLQIILSTAHPAKFKDTVMNLLNNDNFVTDKVKTIMNMKEEMIILENDVNMVKKLLMEQIA